MLDEGIPNDGWGDGDGEDEYRYTWSELCAYLHGVFQLKPGRLSRLTYPSKKKLAELGIRRLDFYVNERTEELLNLRDEGGEVGEEEIVYILLDRPDLTPLNTLRIFAIKLDGYWIMTDTPRLNKKWRK